MNTVRTINNFFNFHFKNDSYFLITMSGETASAPIFTSKVEWSVHRSAFDTPQGPTDLIPSDKFPASPDSKISWQLQLYPRSDSDENVEYVSLFVNASGIIESVPVKFTLGVIAADGREMNLKQYFEIFKMDSYGWGFPKFIRRSILLDPTRAFFRDDKVTIFCDLEVYSEIRVVENSLSHDLNRMLESGDLSDVTLVVGGEKIKAHKVLLAAGSSVFSAMFKHDMKENRTGRVDIIDLDVAGVKAMLSFLYGREVDLKGIAEKMLPAADKYGVERLKNLCEKEICKELTIENAVDMLRLAELHTAKDLKSRVLSFINLNAAEVAEQDSFWDLANSNQDLLREAFGLSPAKGEQKSEGSPVERRKLN